MRSYDFFLGSSLGVAVLSIPRKYILYIAIRGEILGSSTATSFESRANEQALDSACRGNLIL